jgi:type VI secretion system Hcp family effector
MSFNAYLALKLNGTDVVGEPFITQMGAVDVSRAIELHSCTFGIAFEGVESTRRGTGQRVHQPFRARKRVDASTPLLYQGLAQNQQADAVVHCFRVDPSSGVPENHLDVELQRGRIVAVSGHLADRFDAAQAGRPLEEELAIVYHTIVFRHLPSGVEVEIPWDTVV